MLGKLINVTVLKDPLKAPHSAFDDPAEAIVHLLRRAGYNAALTSNAIAQDALNVVIGAGAPGTVALAELRGLLSNTKSVVFNFEQIDSGSFYLTDEYLGFLSERMFFDYNETNILSLSRRYGMIKAIEFPVIPIPSASAAGSLKSISEKTKFLFYGALSKRRVELLRKLVAGGIDVDVATDLYGDKLSAAIRSARAVLNLHFYENSSIFETARCLRPASVGVSVLSETSVQPRCLNWANIGVLFSDPDSLVSGALSILANPIECLRRAEKRNDLVADARWVAMCVDAINFAESEI
jgi:hypothetical protein